MLLILKPSAPRTRRLPEALLRRKGAFAGFPSDNRSCRNRRTRDCTGKEAPASIPAENASLRKASSASGTSRPGIAGSSEWRWSLQMVFEVFDRSRGAQAGTLFTYRTCARQKILHRIAALAAKHQPHVRSVRRYGCALGPSAPSIPS